MKKKSEIAGWARSLNIPQAVRDAIRGWPLVGFLLGERYLSAIEPPMKPEEGPAPRIRSMPLLWVAIDDAASRALVERNFDCAESAIEIAKPQTYLLSAGSAGALRARPCDSPGLEHTRDRRSLLSAISWSSSSARPAPPIISVG